MAFFDRMLDVMKLGEDEDDYYDDDEMYDDDTVRHSTHVYAGHGMERIEKYAVIDQTESIFVDRFL